MPPTLRRAVSDPAAAEANVRDILSRLRDNADRDTAEVLTSGLNTFISSMIRFRGNCVFNNGDVESLLELWNILLNLGKAKAETEFDFRPKTRRPVEVPESATSDQQEAAQ